MTAMADEKKRIWLNKETAGLAADPSRFIARNSGFVYIFCAFISWPIITVLQLFREHMGVDAYFISAMTVPYVLMLLVIAAFALGYRRPELLGFSNPKWHNMIICPLLIFSAYPLMMLVSALSRTLFPKSALEVTDTANSVLLSIGPVWGFIVLAVVPAICEELLCRGLIFGAFRKRSFLAAYLISAVSFSIVHGNIEQMLYAFVLGLLLGLVREFSGSAVPCMLMHFLFNSVSAFSIYFGDVFGSLFGAELEQGSGRLDVTGFFVLLFASTVVMCVLLVLMKRANGYSFLLKSEDDDKSAPAITVTYVIGWAISIAMGILS